MPSMFLFTFSWGVALLTWSWTLVFSPVIFTIDVLRWLKETLSIFKRTSEQKESWSDFLGCISSKREQTKPHFHMTPEAKGVGHNLAHHIWLLWISVTLWLLCWHTRALPHHLKVPPEVHRICEPSLKHLHVYAFPGYCCAVTLESWWN